LSTAEIADCFAAVSQDPGELDLRELLHMEPASNERVAQGQEPVSTKREVGTARNRGRIVLR
jgi:hypothetical protein